ncbi:MAG: sensor histidine kinase [Flavisolibacter sp.]
MDSKETTLFTAIVLSAGIIGLFIAFFIVSLIRQQRRILALSRRNILEEMTALEKERTRIANDLHDELGPLMSVTRIQVDHLTVKDEEEKRLQGQALEHLDNLLTRLREISNNLVPQTLLRKGLWYSLEEFVQKAGRASGLEVQLEVWARPSLSKEMEIHIYRVIQEIVHNIIKHAAATIMVISLVEKEGQLVLTCRDNGKGFDQARVLREGKGQGLSSIQSRMILLGGHCLVQSEPGRGTAYQLTVPISRDKTL